MLDEQMKWLVELQKADSRLREIERLRKDLPREMKRISREIDEERKGFEESQQHLEELTRRRRKKERDLEAEIDRVKRAQSRLFGVKTNKEYQALLREIEMAKEANSALEEEILLLMEEMDELNLDLQQKEQVLRRVERERLSQKGLLESQLDGLEGESQRWRDAREQVISHIEFTLMDRYQKAADRNSGRAVVRVDGGTCQGCFLSIPPQLYNEILKSGPVVQCPFCTRFIYHEPVQEKTASRA